MPLEAIETFSVNGFQISIHYDEDRESPREWDNLGTMVCWHRRSNLGDRTVRSQDFKDMEGLVASFKARVLLPLYLYEHGGMTMRTYPFDDPWDSGQVGWIYTTTERTRKEYGECITMEIEDNIKAVLRAEVEIYDQYLAGDVYGYQVTDPQGKEVESCWGFYGLDYAREQAREAAEYLAREEHPDA